MFFDVYAVYVNSFTLLVDKCNIFIMFSCCVAASMLQYPSLFNDADTLFFAMLRAYHNKLYFSHSHTFNDVEDFSH